MRAFCRCGGAATTCFPAPFSQETPEISASRGAALIGCAGGRSASIASSARRRRRCRRGTRLKQRETNPCAALPPCSCSAAAPAQQAAKAAAPLFQPLKLPGGLELQHRAVMAPLTRCRAPGAVPTPMMSEYYAQRATPGGLIISEATVVSPTGFGYPNTPGKQARRWAPGQPCTQACSASLSLWALRVRPAAWF